nr:MAG TPA: tail tape measure protein [Siphoviridae sp. ctEfY6]
MNDLNRSIKIFIDGTEASAGVKKIEDAISQLENKISSLDKSESGYARKSKTLQKELENKYKTLNTYKQKVAETDRILKNLSGATYDELLSVSQKVRKELRAAIPGTEQYNAALEQSRRVTEAVTRAQKNMRVEVGCQASPIGKAVELFNKYAAVVTTVIAAVTGLTLKLNQLREKRNEREDAKADVEALTGLSKDDINWLEQEAIRLSTTISDSGIRIRQSATEILDAYKLVGSAKPELLSNKEALAAVTEQTLILASASGMTLKDAVDAVTLSMNQYGAEANEASRYANVMAAGSKYGSAAVESVTKAVKSSGVAASSANVSIEQLVGTIETLAEKGIKDEIAGTGLKKFFLTLQTGADETNPKIVGLETALDNLQKKQLSAAQIKKMFGEEGYNVASVLINETEKVKYYTQAVTGTSVAMEQAATKSDTAATKLAQAKNKMNEMGMELMEKLNPSIISTVNGTVNWTRKIIDLIGFMVKHSGIIITLTTAITTYYLAVKATEFYETNLKNAKLLSIATDKIAESWSKIRLASILALSAAKYTLAGNTTMATAAMQRLNATMKGNMIGIIISLLVTAAMAIYQFTKRSKEATEAQEKFQSELLKEQRSLNNLFDALKRAGEGTEDRRRLIKAINETYGQYLPHLLTEKSSLDDINDAYKRINGSLQTQIALKVKNEATDKIVSSSIKEQATALENIRNKLVGSLGNGQLVNMVINDLKQTTSEFQKAGQGWERAWGQAYHTISYKYFKKQSLSNEMGEYMEDYIKSVYDMEKKIAQTEAKFQPFIDRINNNLLPETVITGDKPEGNKTTGDETESEKKRKKQLEEEKKLYNQKQAFLKEMYLEGGDDTLQTEKQFQKEMECLQMEYLERSLKVAGSKSKEGAEIQNQINDLKLKMQKDHTQQLLDEETTQYEKQQQDLKELYAYGKDENLSSETAYNDAMEQLTIMHLERMLSIAGLNAEQRKQVEQQLLDFKVKCMKEEQDAHAKAKDAEQKKTATQTKKEQQQYQERLQTYKQYGSALGSALGNIISGQENAMQGFADTMIDIVFDILGKIIEAEIIKATATATGAVARSTAEAMAMPDSVASFGASGAARAAILTGLIMAALATAKSALKGMIGGKHSSGSSDSDTASSDTPKRATVSVSQWASGRYDVIGKEDGKNYRDIPYIGAAPTGIVRRTSLISENGAELIINADDLSRLQNHINYPLVLNAIEDARSGHVPQRASGNYSAINSLSPQNEETPYNMSASELEQLIKEIGMLVKTLKNLKAYVSLRDIRNAEELDEKSKKPFTRSTK